MKKFTNFKIYKLLIILSASFLASLISCGGVGVTDSNSVINSSNTKQRSGAAATSVVVGAVM